MTISTTASRISYNGNGTTVAFSFPYRFLQNADLVVIRVAANGTETTLALGTDYTVTGADDDAGGTVTCVSAPASGARLVIYRSVDITQEVDYITGDSFPAETHERALDRLTMVAQQLQDAVDRSAKLSETSTADADTLVANINSLAAIEDDIVAVVAIEEDITIVADNIADIQDAEENATAAANSATAASTSATNAASSASTASTAATNAGNSATAAASSASSASSSASAASTSASNASSSASAASTSASNASTSATNAASSASAASTSASGASTSATNASNSATAAATSATNAGNSATAAASSASAAATSETNAAASAAAAASALDSFDDRYLGAKSSDPTVDNDGNALVTGALYYNTTTQTMKVYDGANWIAATAAGTSAMSRYRYVATSGQTTFSGSDANSLTLSYTSGNIVVARNGAMLDPSEYTASNGTSVVLGVAAGTGDVVDIVAFKSFTVADTYSIAGADAEFLRKAGEDGVTVTGGNVGIGTSSPNSKLEISGSSTFIPTTTITADNAVTGWRVRRTGGTYPREYYMGVRENSTALDFYDNTADALRARIDSSGNLLVGQTALNGAGKVEVSYDRASSWGMQIRNTTGTTAATTYIAFKYVNTETGYISSSGTTTAYNTTSDYRLKHDIQPMTGALAKVAALKPVTYKWNVDNSDSQGFIAHELQAIVPECVVGEKDAVDADGNPQYQGIDTSFLVATLTAAIQEQQAIITALTARVAALEGN
jgi:hypothetical protein